MENGYTYRLETPSDYDATEMLTRDAFWNVYQPAADFGIVSDDGSSFPELMACELGTGRLEFVHGRLFFCPEFLDLDQNEVLLFDQKFPPRERLKLPGQLF